MNLNGSTQNQGIVAWDGAAAHPIDIRHHVGFSFTFQTTADLAADALFNVQAAPASGADPCLPGTFVDVAEVPTCMGGAMAAKSEIKIPSGTKKGSICTATLPCKPGAFVQLASESTATASVLATAVLSGPR